MSDITKKNIKQTYTKKKYINKLNNNIQMELNNSLTIKFTEIMINEYITINE